jgi:hypothetical protein
MLQQTNALADKAPHFNTRLNSTFKFAFDFKFKFNIK